MNLATRLAPLEFYARITGRSYWRLRFTDGRTVDEREVDWSLLPQRGRMALQLVCPNGKTAELGNTTSAEGRLFQFKAGTVSAGGAKTQDAHLIGIVTGMDGQCHCAAYDYATARIVQFDDNIFCMRYKNIGRLSGDVLGIATH